jgi:hypothetical protein
MWLANELNSLASNRAQSDFFDLDRYIHRNETLYPNTPFSVGSLEALVVTLVLSIV